MSVVLFFFDLLSICINRVFVLSNSISHLIVNDSSMNTQIKYIFEKNMVPKGRFCKNAKEEPF